MNPKQKFQWTPAVIIILIFGIISLMGDMVYESARSANSQYFNLLHVSAAQVGLVFGLGEFLGYFLRLLAGIFLTKAVATGCSSLSGTAFFWLYRWSV